MNKKELPLGFSFALAQDSEAMSNFSALSESAQAAFLQQAHAISSRDEMQSLINKLTGKEV